jgi:hypothetical protein
MKYNPTREELRALHTSYELGSSRADAARAGWECGYEARKAREKEHFSSAHGTRTVAVLKALLTIIRPDGPQEIAVVDAAVTLLGDLEKSMVSGAMGSTLPIAETKGANGPGGTS